MLAFLFTYILPYKVSIFFYALACCQTLSIWITSQDFILCTFNIVKHL